MIETRVKERRKQPGWEWQKEEVEKFEREIKLLNNGLYNYFKHPALPISKRMHNMLFPAADVEAHREWWIQMLRKMKVERAAEARAREKWKVRAEEAAERESIALQMSKFKKRHDIF
jgi:hypothetical protein